MTESQNIALVRRWFEEVWNQRRLETIDELLAPEAVAYDLGGSGATTRGAASFRAAAQMLHTAFGEMHFVIEDIFGSEDRVVARLTATMRHTGPLGDLPPTGKEVIVPVMCIVRIEAGRLVESWNTWDVATALRAAHAPMDRTTMF
jgi:steroid delta-isomerase-like uncharacterized protein